MTEDISLLWRTHREDPLPEVPPENKGELWVLDEVIGGCIAYYLEAGRTLDRQRVTIVRDCCHDLSRLLPDLDGAAMAYFSRLGRLAEMILPDGQRGSDG